jgi:hypothetical protein
MEENGELRAKTNAGLNHRVRCSLKGESSVAQKAKVHAKDHRNSPAGKNIGRPTRTATLTAAFANSTNAGDSSWMWCCGRTMRRERSSSSITPGRRFPSMIPQGGPERQAAIFVAVLGASNYTYAEATESQELEHWIGSHIRAFEFLGGVPKLVIPDNTRTA